VNIRTRIPLLALPFVLVGCTESSPVPASVSSDTAALGDGDGPELPFEDLPVTDDDSPPPAGAIISDATVIGFDRDQAKADGYEIRSLPDGTEYSVPIGTPADAIPNNLVVKGGNCGTSWVSETAVGNVSVDLGTGFNLFPIQPPAVAYTWKVRLDDRGGTSYQYWSGFLRARKSWKGWRRIHGLTPGAADAMVVRGSSLAILVGGLVCGSTGPRAISTPNIF
jgi:hypothetical protein